MSWRYTDTKTLLRRAECALSPRELERELMAMKNDSLGGYEQFSHWEYVLIKGGTEYSKRLIWC